jgi:putative ABC transport system substrate-binding protein
MTIVIGRRQFISALGGAAVTWPLAARAQQGESMRRIGVLTNLATGDPEDQARNASFLQGLQLLGWTVGRNLQIDYRWGGGDPERNRKNAAEMAALAPDVILVTGTPILAPLLQATRAIPIVFVQVPDPVGAGYVESLSRPGGNATGFSTIDFATSGKWLQLLKEIAPNVTRAAVLRDDTSSSGIGQWAGNQAGASSLGVDLRPIGMSDVATIERTIDAFARDPNGGLTVTESGQAIVHREQIMALAARYRLPAVYGQRIQLAHVPDRRSSRYKIPRAHSVSSFES